MSKQGVHTRDASKHEASPRDLLRESPPPDPKDGLTQEQATRMAEDAAPRERQSSTPAGVIEGRSVPGSNKCGARYGRCFGTVEAGVCTRCGYVYKTNPAPLGGVNGRF